MTDNTREALEREGVKTAYADLLNALSDMQSSPAYAARKDVLKKAEYLILYLELELKQLRLYLAAANTAEVETYAAVKPTAWIYRTMHGRDEWRVTLSEKWARCLNGDTDVIPLYELPAQIDAVRYRKLKTLNWIDDAIMAEHQIEDGKPETLDTAIDVLLAKDKND